tara:strand:- start:154 stop:447 length:294 start_codon:yes stop_codon:yes gene_type:complete
MTEKEPIMDYLTITYTTAVYTPAGWRPETVTARAKSLSPKRARVIEVMDIGENGSTGYASRTGANRQQYFVGGVAARETGKIKNLSACEIISPAPSV